MSWLASPPSSSSQIDSQPAGVDERYVKKGDGLGPVKGSPAPGRVAGGTWGTSEL